jgi:hypothetical protein
MLLWMYLSILNVRCVNAVFASYPIKIVVVDARYICSLILVHRASDTYRSFEVRLSYLLRAVILSLI